MKPFEENNSLKTFFCISALCTWEIIHLLRLFWNFQHFLQWNFIFNKFKPMCKELKYGFNALYLQ